MTALIAWDGGGAAPVLRHLYVGPVLWAALRFGAGRGCLLGLVAGLLQAPRVLPAIESLGITPGTVDGLVSLVAPIALGGVVGRLRDRSRAGTAQLAALLDMQRAMAADGPLEERLRRVATRIRDALDAGAVGLIVGDADGQPVAVSLPDGGALEPRSAGAWVWRKGEPVEVRDIETDARFATRGRLGPSPVRGTVMPLRAGGAPVGALALQWTGDPGAHSRLAAEELAVHLGLVIDNARLTLRQRGFARELEDKVSAATERLRELDRAKSEFLSVVSHELRTPLTALQGFSELLLTRNVPPARAERFLGHLHTEARRLGRIVGELLDLSRIESGRREDLRRDAVSLDELIEANVEMFAAEHASHRFEWTAEARSCRVTGDRDALDRVVKNLMSNAVKYSPRGGTVRVSAGPAVGEPGMVELAVADEGVGIPAEDLPRIWDKYVRVPDPETTGARGLGLGLSLVRSLVEAHGGRVHAESEPGRGSRFRVLVPG